MILSTHSNGPEEGFNTMPAGHKLLTLVGPIAIIDILLPRPVRRGGDEVRLLIQTRNPEKPAGADQNDSPLAHDALPGLTKAAALDPPLCHNRWKTNPLTHELIATSCNSPENMKPAFHPGASGVSQYFLKRRSYIGGWWSTICIAPKRRTSKYRQNLNMYFKTEYS